MIKPKEITGMIRSRLLSPRNLLVFEDDGFGLRGHIVENKRGRATVKKVYESSLPEQDKAMEELMIRLQTDNALPKKAIVVSSDVLPVLLELPINPGKPRPYRQMHEMVRWEIEPYLTEQVASIQLGSLLVGKSYIDHEQAKEIVLSMEGEKGSHRQTDQPVLRFGELALKKGFITNDQLDECLAMQDRFQFIQADPVCGWSFQMPADQIAEDTPKYKWLACGVGKSVLNQWKERLGKYKLEISGLYPMITSLLAILNTAAPQTESAVFEVYKGTVSYARLTNGAIYSLHIHHMMAEEKLSVSVFGNFINSGVERVLFAGRHEHMEEIAEQSKPLFGKVGELFVSGGTGNLPGNVKAESLVNVLGAASHSFRLPDTHRIACVRVKEPSDPLMTRPAVWIILAVFSLALILGILDISLQMKMGLLGKERKLISNRLDPLVAANEKISKEIALNENLQKVLTEKKMALRESNKRLEFLNKLVVERSEFTMHLLKAVSAAIPGQVALDKLKETGELIEITGWTATEKSAQEFVENLTIAMKGKSVNIEDLSVRSHKDSSGIPSYGFSLKITPAEGN